MRCPECLSVGATGAASRVVERDKRVIKGDNKQFWDERGQHHVHDLTCVVTPFACSEGHAWEHRSKSPCPTCRDVVDPRTHDDFGRPR